MLSVIVYDDTFSTNDDFVRLRIVAFEEGGQTGSKGVSFLYRNMSEVYKQQKQKVVVVEVVAIEERIVSNMLLVNVGSCHTGNQIKIVFYSCFYGITFICPSLYFSFF